MSNASYTNSKVLSDKIEIKVFKNQKRMMKTNPRKVFWASQVRHGTLPEKSLSAQGSGLCLKATGVGGQRLVMARVAQQPSTPMF
eukprot:4888492-Amphidinium_carterae.1